MKRYDHFRQRPRDAFGNGLQPGARRHFVSPIISALGMDAGSTLASIAAPAITGAAVGAGTAALTHGNIGEGALIGGIGGGALGYMTDASGTPTGTGLYNDASGALGSLFGGGGTGATQTMLDANGNVITTDASGNPLYQGPTPSGTALNAAGTSGGALPTSTTGQAARIAGGGGGLFGGAPGGISNTALALGALSAAGSLFNKPTIGTWQTPGPSSTAANQGPYYNMPLNTNVPGRTPVTPASGTDWYTYGQRPEQTFFQGNTLQNYGWKHGGALGHVFSTEGGQRFVRGPGTGTSDSVPAKLSSGEYVLTHADVSRLGGGSNERGAAILDHDRSALAHALGEKKFVRQKLKRAA
jgi:hypothetical protein